MKRCLVAGWFFLLSACLVGQTYLITPSMNVVDANTAPWSSVKAGDTVWLQAGVRSYLLLMNFKGSENNPVVFANYNGQTIIDTDFHYGIDLRYSAHVKFAGIPGNGYDYGLFIRRVGSGGSVGIAANNKSTNVEITGAEITNVGFAGIMAKTDPDCSDPDTQRGNFVQYNTRVNHCYIHDVPGEAMYIGSSFYNGQNIGGCGIMLPPLLEGVYIHHNRIERTGLDGIQVSCAVKDCYIHDNYLTDCSYLMETAQMSGIIIGGGTKADCYNNTILDPYGTGILLFGKGGTRVYNNLIVRAGLRYYPGDNSRLEHGIFVSDKTGDEKTSYGIYNNTIIRPKGDGIRILHDVTFPVYVYNNAILDPGSWDIYENDNTSRTGNDAFVYVMDPAQPVSLDKNFFNKDIQSAGFVSAAGGDFHPDAGSPLIDQGADLSAAGITTDLDGVQRPQGQGYDIGCFEYLDSFVDLYLHGLSISPTIIDAGQPAFVTVQYGNQGNAGVWDTFSIQIYLSQDDHVSVNDQLLGRIDLNQLAAGETGVISNLQITPDNSTASGSWFVLVMMDATYAVIESMEGNNLVYATLAIRQQTHPDLFCRNLSVDPTETFAGDPVSISWETGNSGNGNIEANTVSMIVLSVDMLISDDDLVIDHFANPWFEAGSSEVVERRAYRLPSDVRFGQYFLIMKCDPDNRLEEPNESDNTSLATLSILERTWPDLFVDDLSTSADTIAPGGVIRLNGRAGNAGRGWASAGGELAVFLSPDQQWSAKDLLLSQLDFDLSSPGSTSSFTFPELKIPDEMEPGQYYLLVRVDHDNDLEESDESNNQAESLLTIMKSGTSVMLPGNDHQLKMLVRSEANLHMTVSIDYIPGVTLHFRVVDASGKTLLQTTMHTDHTGFARHECQVGASGIYLLSATDGRNVSHVKIAL